eukprot:TRINITY_DN12067_c0_g1_i2.p1 TRINITY_DN12067_c0_g1~~TRINITY_DN12067_c0_g1_i2.p1  ORF type:complete len:458 (+),score=61.90 TRINITY_DN12067_c0_g1_i2:212-1585(+)
MRRSRQNTTKSNILNAFLSATYSKVKAIHIGPDEEGQKLTLDYFDAARLAEFLDRMFDTKEFLYAKPFLLQKFTFPMTSSHNSVFMCFSDKSYSKVEKRTNRHRFTQDPSRFTVELPTYEGQEHLSSLDQNLSVGMMKELDETVAKLLRHLNDYYTGRFRFHGLKLYFRQLNSRLFFLFLSELRVERLNVSENALVPFSLELALAYPPKEDDIRGISHQCSTLPKMLCAACDEVIPLGEERIITRSGLDKIIAYRKNNGDDSNMVKSLLPINEIKIHMRRQSGYNFREGSSSVVPDQRKRPRSTLYQTVRVCLKCYAQFVSEISKEDEKEIEKHSKQNDTGLMLLPLTEKPVSRPRTVTPQQVKLPRPHVPHVKFKPPVDSHGESGMNTTLTIRTSSYPNVEREPESNNSIHLFSREISKITSRPVSGKLYVNSRSCLLYTSPSPRDRQKSRMPSSA